jgi:OFA family oxalate/formate antiporter-like MFS transporter
LFFAGNVAILLIALFLIGACYGANLTLFPSATKDNFGLKSFGLNYGLMFTAWGVGGLILPRIAGMVKDVTGKEDIAFYISSGLMFCGALLVLANQKISKTQHSRIEKTVAG